MESQDDLIIKNRYLENDRNIYEKSSQLQFSLFYLIVFICVHDKINITLYLFDFSVGKMPTAPITYDYFCNFEKPLGQSASSRLIDLIESFK